MWLIRVVCAVHVGRIIECLTGKTVDKLLALWDVMVLRLRDVHGGFGVHAAAALVWMPHRCWSPVNTVNAAKQPKIKHPKP